MLVLCADASETFLVVDTEGEKEGVASHVQLSRKEKRAQMDELRRKKKEMFDKDYDLKDNTEFFDTMKEV